MQGSVSRKIVEGKPKALYLDPGLEAVLTAGTGVSTPSVHHRTRGNSSSLARPFSLAPAGARGEG